MSLLPIDRNARGIQAIGPGVSQRLSFTGTSAQSSAVGVNTRLVQLFATEDCWVVFGTNPTAAVNDGSSFFLPGGIFLYYGISGSAKIAAIQDSTSGYLHIIEAV